MKKPRILLVTIKKWNIENFKKFKKKYNKKFNIYLISKDVLLKKSYLKKINPKYIFFIHWSKIVNKEIVNNYNCYNFHMSDLPYGRGGSPLQNLLLRDIEKTKISLIRMNNKLDAGDIVCKKNFVLKGNAEKIYNSLSKKSFEIIEMILKKNKLKLIKQNGRVKNFKRIKNNKLSLKKKQTLRNIYNQIRMRDAPSYEKTFIKFGKFKIFLKNAKIKSKSIDGKYEIL